MDHMFLSEFILNHIESGFKANYNRVKKLQEIFRLDTIPVYVAEGSEGIVYHARFFTEDGIVLEKAIKIVPVIAVDFTDMNVEPDSEEVYNILSEIIETNDLSVKSEISNWAAASSCEHILPLDSSYKVIKWQSDGRIGIDYALPMPLAECLTEKLDRYDKKKTDVSTEKEETIIHIGIELCKALEELENLSTPICHRDIKPANIYYFESRYCLGDFGIAIETDKTQRTGTGTEAYRAPEQVMHCEQSRRDHRQDIYSLGLVLYEMADTHRMYEYLNDLRSQKPLPHLTSKYSEGLNQILHKATQYYIEARFQHGSEFREALENLLADKEFTLYDEEERYIITRYPQDNGNPYAEVEELFSAETLWNAGHFWYEKSQEEGNRFANLKKEQMFPIYVYEQNDEEHTRIKLSEIMSEAASLTDMYLIGEGGTGKTTALYSIMKNAYKNDFSSNASTKTSIPLFIELSKAPVQYVNAYKDFSSTFIRRYIYFLIKSQREKCNTAEADRLFSDLMTTDELREIEQLDRLLMKEDSRYQYILLLDGLNEISRKQFIEDESENSGSAVEMILYEIQKLQAYKNVTVIITSRADEAEYLETDIAKYYLAGLDNETIKEYLEEHQISTESIEENERLISTLRIPLFLKLYCQLSTPVEISTPGEMLYIFFISHTIEYSARRRLFEISSSQQKFCAPHATNLITERMQFFIMDFLLPEIGWYMEKNELYAVDKETIRDIIEPVLKGENDTDICGKYGRAFFREYHRGNDGSINTQTYAKQLLELNSNNNYIEDIVGYCVYSLGIFFVNNQEYSFIHQHIRDFFAAMKIIINMRMAVYISRNKRDKENGLKCLKDINDELLSKSVSCFIGEISGEYRNIPRCIDGKWTDTAPAKGRRAIVKKVLSLYQNLFEEENMSIRYGVRNLLGIIENSRHTFNGFDFSYLDLRNCYFNGKELKNANMTGCLIKHDNLFPDTNCGEICKTAFSKSGEYIYIAGDNRTVSVWHRSTCTYIRTIKEYDASIYNLSVSERYIAVSTRKRTEILDIHTFELVKSFESYNAVFSPDGKYIVLAFDMKKAQLCNTSDFSCMYELDYMESPLIWDIVRGIDLICFSPDSKHVAIATRKSRKYRRRLDLRSTIQVWNIEKKTYFKIEETFRELVNIDFADKHNLLLVASHGSVIKTYSISDDWEQAELAHAIDIEKHLSSPSTYPTAKFIQNDTIIAISLVSGELFFLDYQKYNKKHVTEIVKKHAHEFSISNMTKFQNARGSYLLTGSMDYCAKLWDTESLQCKGTFNSMNLPGVSSAILVENGKYVITNGRNNSILLWNLKSRKCVDLVGDFPACASKMAYYEKKQQLAVSLVDGNVLIYSFDSKRLKFYYLYTLKMQDGQIFKLEYSLNGDRLLAVGYDSGNATIYDFKKNTQSIISGERQRILTSAFLDPEGKTVIVATLDCHLRVYSTDTGEFIKEVYSYVPPYYESKLCRILFDSKPETCWANGVAVDFNNNLLYLLKNSTCCLEAIDMSTNNCIAILHPWVRGSYGKKLVVSSDGNYITINSGTPNIKIYKRCNWGSKYKVFGSWRTDDSGIISKIINTIHYFRYKKHNGHQETILDISFSADEHMMLTTSLDGTVKLWMLPQEETEKSLALTSTCTLKCIPGLKTQGLILKNLQSGSDLSTDDKDSLKLYGTIVE